MVRLKEVQARALFQAWESFNSTMVRLKGWNSPCIGGVHSLFLLYNERVKKVIRVICLHFCIHFILLTYVL